MGIFFYFNLKVKQIRNNKKKIALLAWSTLAFSLPDLQVVGSFPEMTGAVP